MTIPVYPQDMARLQDLVEDRFRRHLAGGKVTPTRDLRALIEDDLADAAYAASGAHVNLEVERRRGYARSRLGNAVVQRLVEDGTCVITHAGHWRDEAVQLRALPAREPTGLPSAKAVPGAGGAALSTDAEAPEDQAGLPPASPAAVAPSGRAAPRHPPDATLLSAEGLQTATAVPASLAAVDGAPDDGKRARPDQPALGPMPQDEADMYGPYVAGAAPDAAYGSVAPKRHSRRPRGVGAPANALPATAREGSPPTESMGQGSLPAPLTGAAEGPAGGSPAASNAGTPAGVDQGRPAEAAGYPVRDGDHRVSREVRDWPIDAITVADRFRKDLGDLDEMDASI
jgi:hypothetical protein